LDAESEEGVDMNAVDDTALVGTCAFASGNLGKKDDVVVADVGHDEHVAVKWLMLVAGPNLPLPLENSFLLMYAEDATFSVQVLQLVDFDPGLDFLVVLDYLTDHHYAKGFLRQQRQQPKTN